MAHRPRSFMSRWGTSLWGMSLRTGHEPAARPAHAPVCHVGGPPLWHNLRGHRLWSWNRNGGSVGSQTRVIAIDPDTNSIQPLLAQLPVKQYARIDVRSARLANLGLPPASLTSIHVARVFHLLDGPTIGVPAALFRLPAQGWQALHQRPDTQW